MNNAALTDAVQTALTAARAHTSGPHRDRPITIPIATGPAIAPDNDALDESAWTLSIDPATKTATITGAMGHDADELVVLRAIALWDISGRTAARIEREIRDDAARMTDAVAENDALA